MSENPPKGCYGHYNISSEEPSTLNSEDSGLPTTAARLAVQLLLDDAGQGEESLLDIWTKRLQQLSEDWARNTPHTAKKLLN